MKLENISFPLQKVLKAAAERLLTVKMGESREVTETGSLEGTSAYLNPGRRQSVGNRVHINNGLNSSAASV